MTCQIRWLLAQVPLCIRTPSIPFTMRTPSIVPYYTLYRTTTPSIYIVQDTCSNNPIQQPTQHIPAPSIRPLTHTHQKPIPIQTHHPYPSQPIHCHSQQPPRRVMPGNCLSVQLELKLSYVITTVRYTQPVVEHQWLTNIH